MLSTCPRASISLLSPGTTRSTSPATSAARMGSSFGFGDRLTTETCPRTVARTFNAVTIWTDSSGLTYWRILGWARTSMRGGPQSLDRLAAKLRVILLSIICCQIDRSSSSSSQNNKFLVLWSSWARGAKVWSGGGQRRGVAQGLSTRPAGFAPVRRTRPQIHGTGRSTRTERPATGPISAAIPASTSQAARSSHWTPACTSAGVRPPNAECGRSPL